MLFIMYGSRKKEELKTKVPVPEYCTKQYLGSVFESWTKLGE
jgi:hypothetical protein